MVLTTEHPEGSFAPCPRSAGRSPVNSVRAPQAAAVSVVDGAVERLGHDLPTVAGSWLKPH